MVRFGILGTGRIAHTMADALCREKDAAVCAVGSRSEESARRFAGELNEKYGINVRAYGDYTSLCADEECDIVYIATPHGRHFEDTMNALDHGRGVLCEKAFALSGDEARQMIELAREKNLFLCEAMWSRFVPAMCKVRQWLRDGAVGDVKYVRAECGFRADYDTSSRLCNLEAGGGALLDVGIYPLSFVSMVFGGAAARSVSASSLFFPNGADSITCADVRYDTGIASITGSLCAPISGSGYIYGDKGKIVVCDSVVAPTRAILYENGGDPAGVEFVRPHEHSGYEHEIRAVISAFSSGAKECPIMPHEETLRVMNIVDCIKAATGLRYPNDR